VLKALDRWPLVRQLLGTDRLGRGAAVKSRRSEQLRARTAEADEVIKSVCPYCAVGCAQNVYVQDGKVTQIEGDPDAPHSRGRLCPKGAATLQLTTGDAREHGVLYRRPGGSDWEELDLETAMDMVAERIWETRRRTWIPTIAGHRANHTTAIAHLGGATLDNEENYLIKKRFTAGLGMVAVSTQARI